MPELMNKKRTEAKLICMGVMLTLLLLIQGGQALAQDAPSRPDQPQANKLVDAEELEHFLDGVMSAQLESYRIPGATVAVVKDGELFFAKGYGYADLEHREPVVAEETLFRVGSVGKVFTATAVMQLAEEGKLDLNADVNTYLDFRIPDTYPQPITLKNLLTHTSGFESLYYERLAKDPNDLLPPREWLISHMPARVSPPGEVAAYSSYGAALAGYIVARVSGEPYDQYLEEHILNPLGMAHTTAKPSMPPNIRAHTSVGYVYEDGAFKEFPDTSEMGQPDLEYSDMGQPALVPAGDMQSSATDMARFMIAHLQNGRYSNANTAKARILNNSTTRQMHSTLYTPDPRLLGTTYGFFDFSDNGQRTWIGSDQYSAATLARAEPGRICGLQQPGW